jgi:signal recognition particle receptor subunit beta
MKIPKTLKIGAHTYKVRVMEFTDDANGDQDSRTGEIRINKEDIATQQGASLIHEILHVCNATLSGSEMGHALLEAISQQIYQVLEDNKMLK